MTYKNKILFFDEYDTSRCVSIDDDGDLRLNSASSQCDEFNLVVSEENGNDEKFYIQLLSTGECFTMGDGVGCNDDRSTGGNECSGVDHRFLPLKMGSCNNQALSFQFETKAEDCANGQNEYPSSSCF